MMVRAVVPPTVPEGTSRVRICLHAGNTEEHVGRLVESLGVWCRRREGEGNDDGNGDGADLKGRGLNGNISARL